MLSLTFVDFCNERKLQIEYWDISLFIHVFDLVIATPDLINQSISQSLLR